MTPQDFEEFSKDILEELRCRSRIHQLQEWRSNGVTTLEAGLKYERDKQARVMTLERFGGSLHSSANGNGSGRYRTSSAHRSNADYGQGYNDASSRKKTLTISDIQHGADYGLLSAEEQQLCIQLKILPKPYLAIKEVMFRELLRAGGTLKKRVCRDLLNIDPAKANKIYDFFQSQRWL